MSSQKILNKTKYNNDNIMNNTSKIIEYVYSENFFEILLKEKSSFLNNIENQVLELLKLQYKDDEVKYQKELAIFEKNKDSIKSRYELDSSILNEEYNKYIQSPDNVTYLTRLRKHCLNSEQIPMHKCTTITEKYGKFIYVNNINNNNVDSGNGINAKSKNKLNSKNYSYVICSECLYCYMTSLVKVYCSSCKCEYYSSKIEDNENENILPATWNDYHCKPIIVNEMMKCVKCENILHINLITKKLVCLNKKCNFSSNPQSIVWKCKICKKDFRSSAKVFNPLEIKILQKEVWKSLIYKNLALPQKIFCCFDKEKKENIKYFHDKKCKGELYKGEMNGKEIVVCGKCHAVNFYEKFIWTCPICNTRYYYHGKKHKNENNNLILKCNFRAKDNNASLQKYISGKKHSSEKVFIEFENDKNSIKASTSNKISKIPGHRHNFSTNIRLFTQDNEENNDENKRINYGNTLTIPSAEASNSIEINKNNQTSKKDDIYIQKSLYINNNIPKPKFLKKNKKARYQTLFDILEEREKYKVMNQSKESKEEINNENNNNNNDNYNKNNNNNDYVNSNLTNSKNKMTEYFNKKRLKLLKQTSKPQTSMKKEKNNLIHKYFMSSEKANSLKNNIMTKNLTKDKGELNNIINISDSEEKEKEKKIIINMKENTISNNKIYDNQEYEYSPIKKNLRKKFSGDLQNFSLRFIEGLSDYKNYDLRIINGKDKLYSKKYKDDQSIIICDNAANDKPEEIIKNKSSNKNNNLRHKISIDTKKQYLKESNNTYKNKNNDNESNKSKKKYLENNLKVIGEFIKNEKEKEKENSPKNSLLPNDNNLNNSNDNNKCIINKEVKKEKKEEIKEESKNELENNNDGKKEENKLEKDSYSSSRDKRKQLFKKIFLNKIKQKRLNKNKLQPKIKTNIKTFNYNNNKDNNIKDNIIFNKNEMEISPFGDIALNIVTKEDFINISKECKIPTFDENDITYIKPIGKGSYGVIYLVEDKNTKEQYALKSILCQDKEQILKHKKEFELCYSLNHPNFIKIYKVLFKYMDSTTYILYVLMEKAETDWNTEIEKRVKSQNFYSEIELIQILKKLVSVLCYFQKNNIAHRDVKPQNILICSDNMYKLTDLGEAKNVVDTSELSTLKGTQLFMSPNLYLVLKYDGSDVKVKHNPFRSDVFSLGYCFLYAMSLDLKMIKLLREETAMVDVFSIIKRFGIEYKYSTKFLNIIYKMIETDENKRVDFIDLENELNKNF